MWQNIITTGRGTYRSVLISILNSELWHLMVADSGHIEGQFLTGFSSTLGCDLGLWGTTTDERTIRTVKHPLGTKRSTSLKSSSEMRVYVFWDVVGVLLVDLLKMGHAALLRQEGRIWRTPVTLESMAETAAIQQCGFKTPFLFTALWPWWHHCCETLAGGPGWIQQWWHQSAKLALCEGAGLALWSSQLQWLAGKH